MNKQRCLTNEQLLYILSLSEQATAIYTSEDLVIETVNEAMLAIWGKQKSVIGLTFEEAIPEIKGQPFTALLQNVWRTGETYEATDTRADLVVDGHLQSFYFDFKYRAIKDESGAVWCIYHTATDVTIRVLAKQRERDFDEEVSSVQEELAASNEELSATIEELQQSQAALLEANDQLEERVTTRTKALADSEAEAQALNEELMAINEELMAINEEMAAVNEELTASNEELSQTQAELQETVVELTAAKQKTERDEKLFRSIALNIPNSLIIVVDKDQRFLLVEGDMMVQLGYDGKNYEGKHPAEIASAERYQASKPLYDRMLAGEQFSFERKGERGNDMLVHMVPLKDGQQEIYGGLIVAFDITDIKQAEEKSAKLAAIIESSDDAIVGKTLESVVTSWNQAAERIFGYTAAEIIGQSILKIIPKERQQEEALIIEKLRNGDRVEHFETVRITKDGRLIDLSLTISPVRDKQGKIIGVSKIARDISEKKRDEIRKNDFIGMVSHELKTPLTSLSALVQVTASKLKDSPDTFLAGAMEKAQQQVRKMSTMINGFLNLSRFESGKILIDKTVVDLAALVEEVISDTMLTAGSHEILFEPCGSVMVSADASKIGAVITNLISNALKYSPKEKPITVSCAVFEHHVQVSVQDQGIGIAPEDQAKLFDRYYRVENPNTRHISGFGIGLYLSSEIIQRHNGRIWVESEPGQGSTFYFSLPFAGDRAAEIF